MTTKTIDIHIHLAGSGCQGSGCTLSDELRKRYTIRLLQMMHRVSNRDIDTNFDQTWPDRISKLVEESEVDFGVILGFDGITDKEGRLNKRGSQMIIPAPWVFKLCHRYRNLLPGPSINPHRNDALDLLDYCIEQKATLIKWLPSAQLINPSDPRLKSFYEKVQQSGIPLLVHCGGERTFKSFDESLNQVSYLQQALEHGVKVICAHSATKVIGSKDEDQLPLLKDFLNRYPNLWVDNSGICNPSRFSHLPALAMDDLIVSRTLYGSDWPVPSNAFYYLGQMGLKKTFQIERIKNIIDRDLAIKEFFGYRKKEMLTRPNKVLANIDFWTQASTNE